MRELILSLSFIIALLYMNLLYLLKKRNYGKIVFVSFVTL